MLDSKVKSIIAGRHPDPFPCRMTKQHSLFSRAVMIGSDWRVVGYTLFGQHFRREIAFATSGEIRVRTMRLRGCVREGCVKEGCIMCKRGVCVCVCVREGCVGEGCVREGCASKRGVCKRGYV